MDDEIDLMLLEIVFCNVERCVGDDLIDIAARCNDGNSLFHCHDRPAFIGGDDLIGVDSDNEIVSTTSSFLKELNMTWVH
jgi:hypothetical protein